jgi:AAA15 family ATPase/GTPase
MLIQFTVGNYRSFKSQFTLNLEASFDTEHQESVFVAQDNLKLLKSAAIYGANASGKSNLFNAFAFMHAFIINSYNAQITSKIPVEPFKLSTETEHKPSHFEIVFIYNDVRYRYGFEATAEKVFSEWFFSYPKGKETKLFTRKNNNFDVNLIKFAEGKSDLLERTRQNALLISVLAQFNGVMSKNVLGWLSNVNVLSGLNQQAYSNFSVNKLKEEKFKQAILDFIQSTDNDIADFLTEPMRVSLDSLPPILTEEARAQFASQASRDGLIIKTLHNKYNNKNEFDSLVPFELGAQESAGTIRLFFLAAPLLDTLSNGKVLFIDEMDAQLHPLIIESLIKLFNSKQHNPNNAQLVFSAHSTLILCNKFFRRDQLWFIQKDKYGTSELYSLDDYIVRKDSSFEKDYLLGKYGGIPILNIYDEEGKKN